MTKLNELPPYMNILSNNIYKNKVLSGILDDSRIVTLTSCWSSDKIIKDVYVAKRTYNMARQGNDIPH